MDGKEGEKKEDERGKKHVKILHARETEKTVKKFEQAKQWLYVHETKITQTTETCT
jgi:hypothetical protein